MTIQPLMASTDPRLGVPFPLGFEISQEGFNGTATRTLPKTSTHSL